MTPCAHVLKRYQKRFGKRRLSQKCSDWTNPLFATFQAHQSDFFCQVSQLATAHSSYWPKGQVAIKFFYCLACFEQQQWRRSVKGVEAL